MSAAKNFGRVLLVLFVLSFVAACGDPGESYDEFHRNPPGSATEFDEFHPDTPEAGPGLEDANLDSLTFSVPDKNGIKRLYVNKQVASRPVRWRSFAGSRRYCRDPLADGQVEYRKVRRGRPCSSGQLVFATRPAPEPFVSWYDPAVGAWITTDINTPGSPLATDVPLTPAQKRAAKVSLGRYTNSNNGWLIITQTKDCPQQFKVCTNVN